MRPVTRAVTTLAAAGLLAVQLGSLPVRADDCTSPPADALPLATSMDDLYPSKWCNPSVGPTLASGLHLDASDWKNGYGVDDNNNATCDPNHFLTRLLNAAWIVLDVQHYAVPFGEHRQVKGLGGSYGDYDMGHWWDFASTVEDDEWEPDCGTDAAATNYYGVADFVALKVPGAYNMTAIGRAGVIVHEQTHADVGHIDDGACSAGGSCDPKYGEYNANTMEVNFDHDAAAAYVTQEYNGQTLRPVNFLDGGQCSYIPRFSWMERSDVLSIGFNILTGNFQQAPPPALDYHEVPEDVDAANGMPFPCLKCDTGKYTFDPNECKQSACNEVLNPANAGVNLLNRIACNVYNQAVGDQFTTPAIIASAKAKMQASLKPCLPPTDQAARAYCDAEKASVQSVLYLDTCGWLDTYYGPELAGKLGCVQEYCQENYVTDAFVCLEYLCADQFCGDAASVNTCQEAYFAAHGDPDLYVPQCQTEQCKSMRMACLLALHKMNPPQWSYGDPIPEGCKQVFELCELSQTLATKVWTEYQPIVDPGPLGETIPDVLSTQPAKNWDRYVTAFRAAAARGDRTEELGRLAREMTAIPEMVAALYNAAPGEFVGLFGKEGFTELLGPSLARVEAKPFDEAKLTPAGRAALEELRRFLATVPGGRVEGAIGKIGLEAERR